MTRTSSTSTGGSSSGSSSADLRIKAAEHKDAWSHGRAARSEVGPTHRHRAAAAAAAAAGTAFLPPAPLPPPPRPPLFPNSHPPYQGRQRRPPGGCARAPPTMKLPWLLALTALLAHAATVSSDEPPRSFVINRAEPRRAREANGGCGRGGLYINIYVYVFGFVLVLCVHECVRARACSAGFLPQRDGDVCDRWEILHSTYLSSLIGRL